MSYVASHKFCEELYEVSKWYFSGATWHHSTFNDLWTLAPANDKVGKSYGVVCPAYTAGYLLRRLPNHYPEPGNVYNLLLLKAPDDGWMTGYCHRNGKDDFDWKVRCDDNNPENALTKLAIELFKQGVLK